MAPALNYGQQAYEGLKAFRTPGDGGKIQLFRPDKNAARMQRSADFVSIPAVPTRLFLAACRAAVALNAEYVPPHETGAAMYVRPQIYGSSAQLGLSPPDEYTFCVYVVPTGVYHGTQPVRALVLDEFDRAAPRGTGSAKVGGNYAPVLRWSDRARREGFGITLHLDSRAHEEVDEFSTSGFVGAEVVDERGRVRLVVPDSGNVIDSVTSDSVLEIGRSFGWEVEKRAIKYAELAAFSEVMAAGTAAGLVPIRSITRKCDPRAVGSMSMGGAGQGGKVNSTEDSETVTYVPDGQDEAGPICLKLLERLRGIQSGKVEDKFGWCHVVSREDGVEIVGEDKAEEVNGETVDQMD